MLALGGTIAVSRTTPAGALPGCFADPNKVLDEFLTITNSGLGTGWTATLTWQFDAANAARLGATPISRVYQFDGGSWPTRTFNVTPSGNSLTITGVNGFSTWYAGNDTTVPVEIDWFAVE